jgi:hypothetical protein
MSKTKVITIDGHQYALPEGMTSKDTQALAGFLVTLVRLDYEYMYGQGDSLYYPLHGASVSLSEMVLTTKEDAKQKVTVAREAYEAKRAAEAAALTAAAAAVGVKA